MGVSRKSSSDSPQGTPSQIGSISRPVSAPLLTADWRLYQYRVYKKCHRSSWYSSEDIDEIGWSVTLYVRNATVSEYRN